MTDGSAKGNDSDYGQGMRPLDSGSDGNQFDPDINRNQPLNAETSTSNGSPIPHTETWRHVLGRGMDTLSGTINEHIVAARYGTFATIALLGAWGIAQTPLFFRFKTVRDIPGSLFSQRRTLHCRLIRVVENKNLESPDTERPIVFLVRHLSPSGRLLTGSMFDFFMKSSPTAATGTKMEDNSHELLKVEVAGVRQPPLYHAPGHAEQPGEWLRLLADQRTSVACQLLCRRARKQVSPKRNTPTLAEYSEIASDDQTAVCRISFRPSRKLFPSDLAQVLIRHGRANVASGLYVPDEHWTVVDTSSSVDDLEKDAKYIEHLEKAEFEAAKESAGMWADKHVRDSRDDIVEEVTFQANASFFKKIWRWLRG